MKAPHNGTAGRFMVRQAHHEVADCHSGACGAYDGCPCPGAGGRGAASAAACAETGGAITLFVATNFGIPVSTTHTITGAIVGVGSVTNASAVRWGVAGRIVWAWILTIPCSAFIAALTWVIASSLGD